MAVDPEELRRTAAAARARQQQLAEEERARWQQQEEERKVRVARYEEQRIQEGYNEERSRLEGMHPRQAAEHLIQKAASDGRTAANLVIGKYDYKEDEQEGYYSSQTKRRAAADVAQQTAASLNAIPGVKAQVEVQDGTRTIELGGTFANWYRSSSTEVETKEVILKIDVDP